MLGLLFSNVAISDNVEELIELFRIKEEIEAQYKDCLDSSSNSIEAELQSYQESGELGIEAGDKDWALLITIYAEYYNALCEYLSGDEILNYYRAEFRRRFASEEIDSLIRFHKTPVGKKLNDELFEINRVYGKLLGERQLIDGQEAQNQFDKRIEEFWYYREERLSNGSQEQDA